MTDGAGTDHGRVLFSDIKPYEAPDSLDELRGPTDGVVELPHSVFWAPGGGRIDLDEPGGAEMAYRALLSEGTASDQTRLLNQEVLVRVWADLVLPRRVRDLWESKFPELRTAAGSGI